MTERTAAFLCDGDTYYPANKNATAVCTILSRMTLNATHMILVRAHGYTPRLMNGTEIGKVEVKV